MIFSFMVALTLSILDLAVNISALHLPVLIMWIITVSSVILTAIYCFSQSSPVKRFRDGTCVSFGRERNQERRSLSQRNEGANEGETVTYGLREECMESTTKVTIE